MRPKIPNILLLLALLAHLARWIGIRFLDSATILQSTPLHFLFLALLLAATAFRDRKMIVSMITTVLLSMLALWSGAAFGGLLYGPVAGFQIAGVPVALALYLMVSLSGICSVPALSRLPVWQKIIGAGLMAVAFAWLLAPAALSLEYWKWASGAIPNSYYAVSALLAMAAAGIWSALQLRPNHFAVSLLLLEVVFLALMRL